VERGAGFLSAVSAHDFWFAGASPKYSATCALALGETIQSIQRYVQLGCWDLDEIIQVSDQPVEPSLGRVSSTGTFSPCSRFAITCQVVPTTELRLVNADISLV
jgi:hypothetical protein